jgi:hypothetical protein
MEGALKWILIAVAVYLGWRFLSGALSATRSYSTGTAWGGGIIPSGTGTYLPGMGYYAPQVFQPYRPQWWQGLSAGYSQDNGLSVGFNGGY